MYTGEQSSIIMGNVPGPVVITPIAEEVVARLVTDFSYEGTAQTIIRYYSETPPDLRGNLATLAADSTMPVLLLQGDSDPIQPLSFYPEIAGQFPDASFMLIEDSGHVPMLEQPQAVASLIRMFMDEAG
jgi:pimeloyl-ACP methyl ester carboxylesterase